MRLRTLRFVLASGARPNARHDPLSLGAVWKRAGKEAQMLKLEGLLLILAFATAIIVAFMGLRPDFAAPRLFDALPQRWRRWEKRDVP